MMGPGTRDSFPLTCDLCMFVSLPLHLIPPLLVNLYLCLSPSHSIPPMNYGIAINVEIYGDSHSLHMKYPRS